MTGFILVKSDRIFGEEGARVVSEALMFNRTLTKLDLRGTEKKMKKNEMKNKRER